jgi:dTDP-3,4-didehydro-2,6-dideoxy-alpha-D-glucose 3-reductase
MIPATRLLRIGILGCADIVRRKFLPALAAVPAAALAMVGSRDPARAAALIPNYHCPFTSYAQVLTSPDVDLVYIALPNDLHEEWAIRAMEAGKHVICEKPLGLSLAAVQRMLAVAGSTDRLLYENIMFLHHPQHRLMREIVQTGTIGTIRQLRANFCFNHARPDDFRLNPAQGGGSFQDQARYPLAAALYHLQGKLGAFHGVSRYRNSLDMAISGSAITTANELFTFTIAFDQPYETFYEIIGDKGSLRLDRAYTTPADLKNRIIIRRGDHEETREVLAADHFQLMIEHICRLIHAGSDYSAEYRQIEQRAAAAERLRLGCQGAEHE